MTRFHGRVLGKGMGGIKVHPWVCTGHRAREDCRPELTGVVREVGRMMCTIYSMRISVIHVWWIWKVWEGVLVVHGVRRKRGRRLNNRWSRTLFSTGISLCRWW